MDASDLRIFEAVARSGAMNRAADELHMVQSNVTTRIRQLEEELGAPLFIRESRGVVLTPAGRRLLPYASRVRHLLEEARRAVEDDGRPKGPLAIGSLETTLAVRLSPLLSRYASAYPEVDLVLRTGTTAELVQEVLQRRLDGAFICGPVDHPELTQIPVFREELAMLTAASVRSIDELSSKPDLKILILRAGCSYRQKLESFLARRGIVGVRQLEFGTLQAIVTSVEAGLGVTLLPRSLVERTYPHVKLRLHRLPKAEAVVETVFIRRPDGFASSALTAFLDAARGEASRAQAAE
jgi:LysR family transcriptional regulator, cell division regulator